MTKPPELVGHQPEIDFEVPMTRRLHLPFFVVDIATGHSPKYTSKINEMSLFLVLLTRIDSK
jgi:hypothetical protein